MRGSLVATIGFNFVKAKAGPLPPSSPHLNLGFAFFISDGFDNF
jgi:hypothetical protein